MKTYIFKVDGRMCVSLNASCYETALKRLIGMAPDSYEYLGHRDAGFNPRESSDLSWLNAVPIVKSAMTTKPVGADYASAINKAIGE